MGEARNEIGAGEMNGTKGLAAAPGVDYYRRKVKSLEAHMQELVMQNEFYRSKLVEIANEDGGPMEGSITARRQRDIARAALKQGEK